MYRSLFPALALVVATALPAQHVLVQHLGMGLPLVTEDHRRLPKLQQIDKHGHARVGPSGQSQKPQEWRKYPSPHQRS